MGPKVNNLRDWCMHLTMRAHLHCSVWGRVCGDKMSPFVHSMVEKPLPGWSDSAVLGRQDFRDQIGPVYSELPHLGLNQDVMAGTSRGLLSNRYS